MRPRSGPSKPLQDFPIPAAWDPVSPLLCDIDRSMIWSNNLHVSAAFRTGNFCFGYCYRLPTVALFQSGQGPCTARIAGILIFLFLCKPLATPHRGTLLGGMLPLPTELLGHHTSRTPPLDKPMDKWTQPSHIPCSDLVSQKPLGYARDLMDKEQAAIPFGLLEIGLKPLAVMTSSDLDMVALMT